MNSFCTIHQLNMTRFEKEGREWFSHKTPEGTWCKGESIRKAEQQGRPYTPSAVSTAVPLSKIVDNQLVIAREAAGNAISRMYSGQPMLMAEFVDQIEELTHFYMTGEKKATPLSEGDVETILNF